MNTIQYLYGFVPSDAPDPPAELRGIDGEDVRLHDVGRFRAVTSAVDADTYAPERLEARLADLGWVGPRGVEHERVVTWFADHASIVPARLLTLFSSDEALADEACKRSEQVVDRLTHFKTRREWDLKVTHQIAAEAVARHSSRAAEILAKLGEAAPGRRYLLERKLEEIMRDEAPTVARGLASELLSELAHHADEITELEIPPTRDALPVVLDAALLVHDDRIATLRHLAAERGADLEKLGVHVALTGPWAPYRFMQGGADA